MLSVGFFCELVTVNVIEMSPLTAPSVETPAAVSADAAPAGVVSGAAVSAVDVSSDSAVLAASVLGVASSEPQLTATQASRAEESITCRKRIASFKRSVSGYVLAVDLGSTGVKVAVVDEHGTVLGAAGQVLTTIFTADGGVEQDPNEWWAAIGQCARRVVGSTGVAAADVTLVAVTSQYSSTVAVDVRGLPLTNAVMWMDGRGRRVHPGSVTNR